MTAGDYFGIEDLFLKKRFFSAFCESQNTVIYEVSREHFKSKQLLKQMQKLSLQKLRFLAHKLEL
jgi:CRP-like cAMP-binding protein